jgi:hypothetical protein
MVGSPLEFSGVSQWLGFVIGAVLAMIALGEGQAYFVSMFQVYSQREKMVHDLNPSHHVDVSSLPLLILAGWTWSRKRPVRPPYFPDSRLCCALVPLSGAVAVLLLSGILGTFHMIFPGETVETAIEATTLIMAANLLIPVPPLALGRALCCPFEDWRKHQSSLELGGAVVLTAVVLVEYWARVPLLQRMILPVSETLSRWIVNA